MPPKKVKSSKKSGKKKSGKKSAKDVTIDDIQLNDPELNIDYYLQIKELERKLKFYKEKTNRFQTANDNYMKHQKELSQEKHDLISFLEKNLMNRGDEYFDLKDRYFGLQQAKEAEKNQYESTLQEIRSNLQTSKDELTREISIISAQLAALDEFKVQKEKRLEEYAELQQMFESIKENHKEMLEEIQGKRNNDHDRLKKEIVSKINLVAADFRRISQKQTSETTKRTIRENVSIRTQLAKMDDKNIELMQENEQFRQKIKSSVTKIKALEKSNNDLASKNISHVKLLHLLSLKHQEHQDIIHVYQKETNIIQNIEEENEKIKLEIEKRKSEINTAQKLNNSLQENISTSKTELEEIKLKTQEARDALIEAVQHLKELLQTVPSSTKASSAKSIHTSMSKRSLSQVSNNLLTETDLKEWGDLQQREIAEQKLQQLLDALDYEENESRASTSSEKSRKFKASSDDEIRNSPSISLGSRNASLLKRLSPVIKEVKQIKPQQKMKILSDYEVKAQAKLQNIQKSKGFCVPGLLQMVPQMDKYIPTNLEKSQYFNKRLNGLDKYSCADDIEKPIKSNLLKLSYDKKMEMWKNEMSS